MLATLDRAYAGFLRALMALAGAYLALSMAAIVYATLFRTLGLPYSGYAFVFIEYGFLYMMMLGAPWLVRVRGHVYIEIVTAAVPDRARVFLSRGVAALCVLACLALGWYGGEVAWRDWVGREIDVRGARDIPRWIATAVLPLGFGLMAIEFLRFVFGREVMHSGQPGARE
jgi:TRAP-type C4-dicarboxylate transport system permease small subunit